MKDLGRTDLGSPWKDLGSTLQAHLQSSRRHRVARLMLAAGLSLPFTGCLRTTHLVRRTVVTPQVLNATLDQLVASVAQRYEAVNTMSVSVNLTASTGGSRKGQVTELHTLAGFFFLRKPADLRVLLLEPVFRSRALDMVSDGKQFKLLITLPKRRAVVGSEEMTAEPSKNGLENLRPSIIRDALLVPPVGPDEFVTLTENTRTLPSAPGRKETLEEPDYDLSVLRVKSGHVLERERVIHIGRATLEPYRLDIYDHQGRILTTVDYDNYQKYGDINYPSSILITRPLDEYSLRIDVTKLTFNDKLDDEQFVLKIPDGVPVQKM